MAQIVPIIDKKFNQKHIKNEAVAIMTPLRVIIETMILIIIMQDYIIYIMGIKVLELRVKTLRGVRAEDGAPGLSRVVLIVVEGLVNVQPLQRLTEAGCRGHPPRLAMGKRGVLGEAGESGGGGREGGPPGAPVIAIGEKSEGGRRGGVLYRGN